MSSAVTSLYEAATQTLVVDKLFVDSVGMGSVSLKLNLANVTNGIVSPNAEVQKASSLAILLKGVDLTVHNDGIAGKGIAFKAALDGISLEQERAALVDLVGNQFPALVGDAPKLKMIGAAVAKFVTDPKTLHISVASKNGFGAADIGSINDPNALLATLDVQASADE